MSKLFKRLLAINSKPQCLGAAVSSWILDVLNIVNASEIKNIFLIVDIILTTVTFNLKKHWAGLTTCHVVLFG